MGVFSKVRENIGLTRYLIYTQILCKSQFLPHSKIQLKSQIKESCELAYYSVKAISDFRVCNKIYKVSRNGWTLQTFAEFVVLYKRDKICVCCYYSIRSILKMFRNMRI